MHAVFGAPLSVSWKFIRLPPARPAASINREKLRNQWFDPWFIWNPKQGGVYCLSACLAMFCRQ